MLLVMNQAESLAAMFAIVRNDNGYLDQAAASLFIAYASHEAAESIGRLEGVLDVKFVVSCFTTQHVRIATVCIQL